jgi:hypothetical protein
MARTLMGLGESIELVDRYDACMARERGDRWDGRRKARREGALEV